MTDREKAELLIQQAVSEMPEDVGEAFMRARRASMESLDWREPEKKKDLKKRCFTFVSDQEFFENMYKECLSHGVKDLHCYSAGIPESEMAQYA